VKNYYKILGVKETASEEKIREKWIKLMRKFHPDWRTQGVPEDERVKEINEAYQTLKFSSTRMKYDLKKVYDRKKRKSYVRRFSFPISMLTALIALLIIGTVYLKNSTNNPSLPNELNGINGPNVPNGPNDPNDPNAYTHQRFNASTLKRFNEPNDPNDPNEPNGLNGPNDLNVIRMTASTHQPSMATEQEIKQFFANYTERYIQKDLDGFLSLFSLRAVQNHQDGWEGIRKIYGDFFRYSKDIRYYLEDTEVEFYQNGLEVKARYELVQTLKRRDEIKTWRGRIRWVLIKEEGALKILSLDYQH
jgi:curved DNA-binding protein CbpA